MNAKTDIATLRNTIDRHRAVLRRIEAAYGSFTSRMPSERGSREDYHPIVIADFFEKYYTCLETVFVRISQHFENNLTPDRWHQDLLDRMRLRIEGLREAAISDETYPLLVELLEFRHFKRYYFDISYDWDKLEYLMKKLGDLTLKLPAELDRFTSFLDRLIAELED